METVSNMVKSGDSGVGCDDRLRARLSMARRIMVAIAGEPEWENGTEFAVLVWPEWVTDEMFVQATTLAYSAIAKRGAHNRLPAADTRCTVAA